MVDVISLRAGNLIWDNRKERVVAYHGVDPGWNFIWVNYANGAGVYSIKVEECDYIPLTAGWLLVKFSFNMYVVQRKNRYTLDGMALTELKKPAFKFGAYTDVKYVHHLQNLFHDIFQKELTYRL